MTQVIYTDANGTLDDGRRFDAVLRLEGGSPSIDGIRVCGVRVKKQWYLVASIDRQEHEFPPRGPYERKALAALLLLLS